MTSLKQLIPSIEWMGAYRKEYLRGDLAAGFTVAVMLIPQAMAYALLAGLPPVMGLYASILPIIVYAFLGTSRQMAVGPVAMVALLVASGIGGLVSSGDVKRYVALTILLTLMVGIIQFSMGLFRLGFLTNFLSHPVASGFTSAAALIIGFSQLKHVIGLNIPRSENILKIIFQAIRQIDEVNLITMSFGIGCIIFLIIIKRISPFIPGALIAVIVSSLLTMGFSLHEKGVKIVAGVPAGFPPFSIPEFGISDISSLLPIALTISLIGFMESIAIAKQIASEKHYEIDSNRELIALGAANLVGAFFKAMPVTGGFSRTAVNNEVGAKTGLSGIVTALVVAIVLLFFTPGLYYLPKAILGAVIMVAVFGLVDFSEVRHLWRVKKDDLGLLLITFMATLTIGVKEGIFLGVVLSMVWFVIKTTRPHYAILGKIPGRTDYRDERIKGTESSGDVLVIRFDSQFYYGNVTFLKETLRKTEQKRELPLKWVVIDAGSINQLDSSADSALHELLRDYRNRSIGLCFAHVKNPVLKVMKRSGFYNALGKENFFENVHDAVQMTNRS